MSRLRLAAYCASGCGGCDVALLELHERLLELAETADIVFWPTVLDFKRDDVEALEDGSIDLCLFNGAIRTADNVEMARLLRAKSKVMAAFGTCAAAGGVPGLANFHTAGQLLDAVYSTESTDRGALAPRVDVGSRGVRSVPALTSRVATLGQTVDVDVRVPGCPPEAHRVWEVCAAFMDGTLVADVAGAGERSVCDECGRQKRGVRISSFTRPHMIEADQEWCLLEQGLVCMGPGTRAGCGSACTSAGMPCRGCYGPAGEAVDQGASMVGLLGSLVDSEDEDIIRAVIEGVVDPAGTFYCFGLPDSILGGAVDPGRERK